MSTTTELDSTPSLASLYTRAVVAPIIPGGGGELPDRRLVLRDVDVDGEHVAAYSRTCGFGVRTEVPGTYPHVLAFPLHMSLMTDRSFPFSVLGLVHITNRIEVLAPIVIGDRLAFEVWAEDLRDHRRGRQFDMVAEAEIDGATVWSSRSTYLRPGGGDSGSSRSRSDEDEREAAAGDLAAIADWDVPGDTGRRYAAVSGDRNPIHMHSLSARLFGFPSAIAHGMWTKARCLASFEGRIPETYAVEAEFKSPLRIPGQARLRSGHQDGGWAFRLESQDAERVHVIGAVSDQPRRRS